MILPTVNSKVISRIYCWETGVHCYGYQPPCHRTSHIHPAVIQCRQQDHIIQLSSELWLPHLWPPQPSWLPLSMSDSYGLITAPVVSQSKYGHIIASCIFHEALTITSWAKLNILCLKIYVIATMSTGVLWRWPLWTTRQNQVQPLPVLMVLWT